MESSPSYYRARITSIRKLLVSLPADKNKERALLRNGVIPEQLKNQFKELLKEEYLLTFSLNEHLDFAEQTCFNTWFEMYPEKLCGKEIIASSRDFPIAVKGTKEDIIKTIHLNVESVSNHMELEALALEVSLQLLNL